MPAANGMPSRASRSRANAAAGRVRIAYRAPIPAIRNSSGIPHNDPHSRKTVNPALGRGSFTNQDVPAANTTAEWKTTSPATTNARITSNSGRRPTAVPAATGAVTGLCDSSRFLAGTRITHSTANGPPA